MGRDVRDEYARSFPDGQGGASAPEGGTRTDYQHWLAGRTAPLVHAWTLLHIESCIAHADAGYVEGLCSGNQRELCRSGDDREWRGHGGLRTLCAENSDEAEWFAGGCSSCCDV